MALELMSKTRESLAICKVKGSSTGLMHAFMNDLVTSVHVLPYGVWTCTVFLLESMYHLANVFSINISNSHVSLKHVHFNLWVIWKKNVAFKVYLYYFISIINTWSSWWNALCLFCERLATVFSAFSQCYTVISYWFWRPVGFQLSTAVKLQLKPVSVMLSALNQIVANSEVECQWNEVWGA